MLAIFEACWQQILRCNCSVSVMLKIMSDIKGSGKDACWYYLGKV